MNVRGAPAIAIAAALALAVEAVSAKVGVDETYVFTTNLTSKH
jgi:methylthioribose-1-phosphate isomerase